MTIEEFHRLSPGGIGSPPRADHIIRAMSDGSFAARPLSVTLAALGAFLVGAANIWRAISIGQQANYLSHLEPSVNPAFRVAQAILWAVLLAAAAIAVLSRQPRTRLLLPVVVGLFGLSDLATIAIFGQKLDVGTITLPLIVFILLTTVTVLLVNSEQARDYFG